MKRIIILIVGLMMSITAFTQKTVAVYVTPNADVPQATTKILSSELVAAITRNADYIAIERADDFMAQLTEEQGRYNNIDDSKLFELGRKYGASNVCVAEITKFGDEFYIVARLLDIRTSRVWKTARKSSELKSLSELIEVSEALSDELIGNIKEFSTYAYGDNKNNQSYITKIENRENYTKVTLKYVSMSPTQKIGISSSTYIEDLVTHERFNLKDAANISIIGSTDNYKTIGEGIWEFYLIFNRITEDTKNIMIIEPNGWAYKDIVLKPYGDENTFVFEDNTQVIYNDWKKQHEKIIGEIQLADGLYYGEIVNGKPNGKGTLYYNSKNKDTEYKAVGNWVNGELNGYAELIREESKYYGDVKNGEPEGHGTLISQDGKTKIVGVFKNRQLNGECTIYKEKDGVNATFKGNMIDGEWDGTVTVTSNGKVQKAYFSRGKIIIDWYNSY